ncbi:hypothetical protein DFQ27_008603 [Actinomortierella ambigua]|uniref:Uncharacterized protein n=1 Tax=Actinomortierella ambigua TaxID=1343610 RepID=A0A9P6TXP1_9FUNG|nr:hypothetical protein DFQ27_008603 [Actinomortierella ambigua]
MSESTSDGTSTTIPSSSVGGVDFPFQQSVIHAAALSSAGLASMQEMGLLACPATADNMALHLPEASLTHPHHCYPEDHGGAALSPLTLDPSVKEEDTLPMIFQPFGQLATIAAAAENLAAYVSQEPSFFTQGAASTTGLLLSTATATATDDITAASDVALTDGGDEALVGSWGDGHDLQHSVDGDEERVGK